MSVRGSSLSDYSVYEYFGNGKMAAVAPSRVAEMRCETARAQEAACETERVKVTHDYRRSTI